MFSRQSQKDGAFTPSGRFPYGPNYASVHLLSQSILPDSDCGMATMVCTRCTFARSGTIGTFGYHLTVSPSTTLHRQDGMVISLEQWFKEHFSKRVQRFPRCFEEDHVEERLLRATVVSSVPSLLFLFITSTKVDIDPQLSFTRSDGVSVRMRLRGVVYYGASHFTSRIIIPADGVWFHNGIMTKGTSVYEGALTDLTCASALHYHNGHNTMLAVYAVA
ncbi:hypothetical protein C8J57DRAFT_1174800 [Mycena rebaudengoi]|nr:hypothetical protein C8J57DRAFT_1174800 [Mycena rebaudengoi]